MRKSIKNSHVAYVDSPVCVYWSVVSKSLQPPWTVACQSPLSMKFSRHDYWNG